MKIYKFSLFIFIYSIFIISSSQAQKIGIRGGGNLTTIIGKDVLPYVTPHFSYNGGLYVEFPYTRNSSTQLEINYIKKGATMRDSIAMFYDAYYEVNEKLDYISLPAIFKLKLGNKKFDLYTDWGVALNMLISSKRTLYGENMNMPFNAEGYYSQELKKYEVDAIFGIGMRFKNTTMDIRYNAAISNLYGGDSPFTARNNAVTLNFAVQLHKIVQKTKYRW